MIKVFGMSKYRFAYKFLSRLKDVDFEGHRVSKVSISLLVTLMGAKEGSDAFVKRYYVKQFRSILKHYRFERRGNS